MRHNLHRTACIAALSAALLLSGCGGGDAETATPTTPTTPTTPPPTTSTPPPHPPGADFNVLSCLQQEVVPGRTVASLVVPDSLSLDFNTPNGFPNGRQLTDSVIDLTLAALFLDLTKEPVTRFTALPLGPQANDKPFRPNFPYLAVAQGTPPVAPTVTSGFNFRTDDFAAYTRVDRMGMPAVATALIGSSSKVKYNDANPIDDDQLAFYEDITHTLKGLTDALSDDFAGLGLKMCATKN